MSALVADTDVVDEVAGVRVPVTCPECGAAVAWQDEAGRQNDRRRAVELWCEEHGPWTVVVTIRRNS